MRQTHRPPRLADRFLKWYCCEDLLEEIQGDLHEAFHHRRKEQGLLMARAAFYLDVIRFCRPYSFEKHSGSKQFLPMYKNYIKISLRNLLKRKIFSALNIMGLSLGIAALLLIGVYVYHEYTYDRFFPEAERTYRLVNKYRDQTYTCMNFENYFQSDTQSQQKLMTFLEDYSEVVSACQFVPNLSAIGPNQKFYVFANNKRLILDNFLFTNTGRAFHDIFPFPYLQGSPENAFSLFQTTVLTRSLATRIFGNEWQAQGIIGRKIQIQEETFTIGGVIDDVPGNVHFDFEAIIHQDRIPSWAGYTYVKLHQPDQISRLIARFNKDQDLMYPGRSEDELQKGVSSVPLLDIHHTGDMLYELKPIANQAYLSTFLVVGVILLFIIWTNYTNLSIAAYANRQQELALRKAIGAQSRDITLQILFEGVLLTIVCLPLAWGLVYLALPSFNELLEIKFPISMLGHPVVISALLAILVITGVISALYPALAFSSKSMANLFAGKLTQGASKSPLSVRNSLLIVQFFLIIVAISITLVIQQQMHYIQSRELGFTEHGVLFFDVDGLEKYELIREELRKLPEVEAIGTGMIPGQDMYNQLTYKMKDSGETLTDGTHIYTSMGSLEVLGIQSEALRELAWQDSVMIVNRTAAAKLARIKGVAVVDLVGETLVMEPEWENDEYGYGLHYSIAGIIDDFNYFNLHHPSQPLLIEVHRDPGYAYNALVRANSNDWITTIGRIQATYEQIETDRPFDFTFLDNHLDQLYQKEKNAGILTSLLTGVAVLLAVMGLVGVVGFITLARQKEIGIRKVFGASSSAILLNLNKHYVVLMSIATLIAAPVAIYLGNLWLESFAFRIHTDLSTIVIPAMVALLLVLLVVSLQSLSVARSNPTDVLRNE